MQTAIKKCKTKLICDETSNLDILTEMSFFNDYYRKLKP